MSLICEVGGDTLEYFNTNRDASICTFWITDHSLTVEADNNILADIQYLNINIHLFKPKTKDSML